MKPGQSLAWFVLVGAGAAATHAAVYALARRGLAPELANLVGFGVAFGVSFTGHRRLSFRDTGTSVGTSLRRFLLTALAGLLTNEAVFVALVRGLGWPDWPALIAAMLAAAAQTFVLGRRWAFSRSASQP